MLIVTAVLLLSVFALYLKKRYEHFSLFKKLGVPGPKPNILFGNMLDMYRNGIRECHNDWAKKYGSVCGYYSGIYPTYLITDLDLLKQIFVRDFTDFTDRSRLFTQFTTHTQRLLDLEGKKWKEVRSVLTPSFTISKLKSMTPTVSKCVDSLLINIDAEVANESFDVKPLLKAFTLDTICTCAMGVQYTVQKEVKTSKLLRLFIKFLTVHFRLHVMLAYCFPSFLWFFRMFESFLQRIGNNLENPFPLLVSQCEKAIKERKQNPHLRRNDLLQLLLDAQNSNININDVTAKQLTAGDEAEEHELTIKNVNQSVNTLKSAVLTDEDVLQNAFLTLIAGFETTSTALSLTMHLLAIYPNVQENLRNEIFEKVGDNFEYETINKLTYLEAVINESLRFHPPVFNFTTRKALVDKRYGNLIIPKGTCIVAPTEFIQHMDEHFENPHEFNPDRFLNDKKAISSGAWQPFGLGPRNCIGMRFAQMNMKIALVRLLQQFKFYPSGNTSKTHLEFGKTTFLTHIEDPILLRVETV